MDWSAPQLRRFEFSFPDLPAIPTADPPPVKPTSPDRSFDVVCYGASTEALLSLTNTAHPLFDTHCYTGLQTYSGAEVMARLILKRPQVVQRGKAVMEIGCGIGLTGVAVARCMSGQPPSNGSGSGAAPLLLLTDGEGDAVRLARCNLALNLTTQQQPVNESSALQFLQSPLALSAQVSPPPNSPPHSPHSPHHSHSPTTPPTLSVHALAASWDASGVFAVSSYCDRALRRPALFDVILATDVFYGRTAVSDILDFALPLLSAATGVLILAHTPRIAHLHLTLRSACQQRSLTMRYVDPSAFISAAEVVQRGWSQVEVALIAGESGWEALQHSTDWQWAEFDEVGRVERQLAEDESNYADDSLVLSALNVCADDL